MIKGRLEELKEQLTESASLVEAMIEKSARGLIERKKEFLLEVIEKDEERENRIELEIDEACIQMIARYQPKARDLRVVMMISRMNNDFERIADEAVNIAEASLFLIERAAVKPLVDIPRMAQEAMGMMRDSLAAFMTEDTGLARDVCRRDDIVDSLRDQVLRELITFMASDPAVIERSIQLIRISRSLERIADLSTNICEDVVYMVNGQSIRHYTEDR